MSLLILEKAQRFLYFYPPTLESIESESQDIPSAILMILEILYYFTISLIVTDSILKRKSFGLATKWFFEDWMASIGLLALERSSFNTYTYRIFLMIPFYKFGLIIYKNWRIATLDPFTWSNWILCIVLMDFMFYVLHRLMHEINFFWVHHQVHHSSQIYTLVSSSRRPIFGFFIDAFALPVCLLFHPRIVFFHWYVNGSVYQFWLHTEFCPKLPWPIEFIFNTPSQHRVHHGVNPYAIDKNYGGFLCIWDRLFGTFAEERDWDKEPLRYGLTTPIQASDPLSIQLSGPFELVKKVFKAKGMDKIRTIFYGPSWVPGAKHRLGKLHPNPAPPLKSYTLYQPKIDSELLLYIKMLTIVSAISIPYFAVIANPALEEAVTFLAMQSAGMILTFKQSIIPVYVEVCRVIATIIFLQNFHPWKYSRDAEKVYLYIYIASLFYLIWYCLKKGKHLKYQSLHEE